MTTLVALTTKDAAVMGCDSLATTTRPLVDPFEIGARFFDGKTLKLQKNKDGEPLLKEFREVLGLAESVPYDHMTDVTKLVHLDPLPLGVMYTGITSIGDRTIKSLLREFMESDKAFSGKINYTVKSVTARLLKHFRSYYEPEFRDIREGYRPSLELIVAGYDKSGPIPAILRVDVAEGSVERDIRDFGIVFGGQMTEIQRIVFGVDVDGRARLESRYRALLGGYRAGVKALNPKLNVKTPEIENFASRFSLFGPLDPGKPEGDVFGLPGLEANWGDFSEQTAIDCVAYFIGIMREGQRFSSRMPTVGGSIHIALINRRRGFRFISREEYRHEDHRVPR